MTTLAVGTDKGLFRFDRREDTWAPVDPQFVGWKVTALGRAADGTYLAGTGSGWYGPAVQRSDDLSSWQQVAPGPQHREDGGRRLEQIWRFLATDDALWLGVAEAGLFRSEDHGVTWEPVPGLTEHPTSEAWMPGAGGLCAHGIVAHPNDRDRLWCAVSAVGVFRTDDGGDTWDLRNAGVTAVAPDERHDIGYCVHAIALDPDDPDRLYRQDHSGMYRTSDGGDSWQRIEQGLPAAFGFPVIVDHSTRRIFAAPQRSDEQRVSPDGAFRVWCSDDHGDSWQVAGTGWPDAPRWAGVLRSAMATDHAGTVVAGTTAGELWLTTDSGEHWTQLDVTLPRIHAVALFD